MTPFESLAVAYFLTLLAAASRRRPSLRSAVYCGGAAALVIVARFSMPWTVRAWLPHALLVLGYWIPAAFVADPNMAFERWLVDVDARLIGRIPQFKSELLELAYLLCYPLVPAAFATVYVLGSLVDVERFWLDTLTAGYACYITLPWTAARPPRLLRTADNGGLPLVAALNRSVLERVSHQLVTFPSGHVAVSLAAAVSVWSVSPFAALLFGGLAVAIAVAAVAGRYHYFVDVLLGVLAGAVVPALIRLFV